MDKQAFIINGIILSALIIIGIVVLFLHERSVETDKENTIAIEELQEQQREDLALITQSFRELQKGLQIENTELEKTLQEQEQQFLAQIQDIERKKEISEQLLSSNNKDLANNLNSLSDKLIELESTSKTSLIAKWSNVTVKLRCTYSDGTRTSGSGFYVGPNSELAFGAGNDHVILTNSHVLEKEQLVPEECEFTWNDGSVSEIAISDEDQTISYFENFDAGFITLAENDVPALAKKISVVYDVCDIVPTSGSDLLILGYPRIGSTEGITSTEGIVSGYDNGFYITSAKISKGNSGGVAIDVQSDCFIGIPTLVRADEVESLGRILDIQTLFK